MGRIRILPDQVANQIAAGEVIERPVAVVKELVENSLDSGATRIEVEFRNGGKRYIRVEDNGSGMAPDEALLALERHATSKIRKADDLQHVISFGFRGEALPSIASVSQFTLRTRVAGSGEGTEVRLNGGKLLYQKACGMPEGTRIEVEQLFNSVPVRRKFLKTDATESAHIVHFVRLLAVAHPQCAFRLVENSREVFSTASCDTLKERLHEIWGNALVDHLIPLEADGDGMKVQGMMGSPGYSRSTRNEIVTLVNRRPVESRTLSYAAIEAYHTSIPKGRYPVVFLFLEIDPAAIDVNVHPAKREIRFRDEGRVRNFIMTTILDRLRTEMEASHGIAPSVSETVDLPIPEPVLPPDRPQSLRSSGSPAPEAGSPALPREIVSKEIADSVPSSRVPDRSVPTPAVEPVHPPPIGVRAINWRFLGKMVHGLVLFETGSGLILMDPLAAEARIRYESIRSQFLAEIPASQSLLIPVALELDPRDDAALTENLDFLNANGFSIEPFGRQFHRVTALPPWLDPGEAESFLRDLIGQIRQRGLNLNEEQPELAHEALARLAVKGQRKDRDLSPQGSASRFMEIAERLLACREPLTDPNGRATFVEFSRGELDRRFGK